jgi:hypothetical protein
MGKKPIKLTLPTWLSVNLGAIKNTLDGLTGLGIAGAATETTYQFVPLATLIFFVLGRYLGYIIKVYINQELSDDEDK